MPSTTPSKLTRLTNLACALTAAGAMLGGVAATATAAEAPHIPSAHHVTVKSDDACTSGFTKGWTSVDMVITNNTGVPLTYDQELSGPNSGHWNRQPQATLAPGECEIVNAYDPATVHVFNLNVVYTMPNGDYVPFEGTAMSTSPSFNQFVFSSEPEYHKNNFYWSGSIDTKHYIAASTVNGLLHSHFVFNAY